MSATELFPLTPGVRPLPLTAECQWHPFPSVKPTDLARSYVVSTPDCEHSRTRLAVWTGKEFLGVAAAPGVVTYKTITVITFWCELPKSPEVMADDLEEANQGK
jgi:hypothetical protein